MTAGVTIRKKALKAKLRREPMSSDEIRCSYMLQLWDEMERLQAKVYTETDRWLTSLTAEDRQKSAVQIILNQMIESDGEREFMNELMDHGEPAWIAENVFVFRVPKYYACDGRLIDLIGTPDVCWSFPSVNIGITTHLSDQDKDRFPVDHESWEGRLVVKVMLIDG